MTRNARVRLDRFRLLAYRSCRDTQFSTNEGVTAIVGPNGVGKTNLLHGILLLRLPGRRRFYRGSEDVYTRECQIEAQFVVNGKPVLCDASITYSPTEQNRDEVVEVSEKWNFKSIDGKSRWLNTPNFVIARYGRAHARRQMSAREFEWLATLSREERKRLEKNVPSDKIIQAFEAIQRFRGSIRYYSASQFTNPALCPTSFEIDEKGDLSDDFEYRRQPAHIYFMYDLYKLSIENMAAYSRYVSLIDADGVGLIKKINWRPVKFFSQAYEVRAGGQVITKRRTRTMIIPTVHVGTSQLSFNQLSEGTLRTMAMIFYVVTDKSELLLLEEPEVCVHHGLLSSVIEIIKEYGRAKQIIFSTHSDAVVDSLRPEQVLLVDKPRNKGTRVVSIPESMSKSGYVALKKYLATAGNLGEYWRHSGFGR